MNIKPGAYRVPLVAGLVVIGRDELSKQVADQRIKLAVSNSITGAVITRRDLAEIFIEALDTAFARNTADDEIIEHYRSKLKDGSIVPVENNPVVPVDRHYALGELFFKS